MGFDLAREALAPEGVLPLRVNEMTPSVIICAEGSRISIQWREQRPDQPNHDEYGRAEAMAAFLVEAANRYSTAYDAIGSGVKALEWVKHPRAQLWRAETEFGLYQVAAVSQPSWSFDGVLLSTGVNKSGGVAATADEAKAAAQADFERRVLSCLSTHTATGAGPVGEAVARELRAEADRIEGNMMPQRSARPLSPFAKGNNSAVSVIASDLRVRADEVSTMLAARPVEEPGEVERLTRERDAARQWGQGQEQLATRYANERHTAEAALAVTGDAQEAGR